MTIKLWLTASFAVIAFANFAHGQDAGGDLAGALAQQQSVDALKPQADSLKTAINQDIAGEKAVYAPTAGYYFSGSDHDLASKAPDHDKHAADFDTAFNAVTTAEGALNTLLQQKVDQAKQDQTIISNAPGAIRDQTQIVANRQAELDAANKTLADLQTTYNIPTDNSRLGTAQQIAGQTPTKTAAADLAAALQSGKPLTLAQSLDYAIVQQNNAAYDVQQKNNALAATNGKPDSDPARAKALKDLSDSQKDLATKQYAATQAADAVKKNGLDVLQKAQQAVNDRQSAVNDASKYLGNLKDQQAHAIADQTNPSAANPILTQQISTARAALLATQTQANTTFAAVQADYNKVSTQTNSDTLRAQQLANAFTTLSNLDTTHGADKTSLKGSLDGTFPGAKVAPLTDVQKTITKNAVALSSQDGNFLAARFSSPTVTLATSDEDHLIKIYQALIVGLTPAQLDTLAKTKVIAVFDGSINAYDVKVAALTQTPSRAASTSMPTLSKVSAFKEVVMTPPAVSATTTTKPADLAAASAAASTAAKQSVTTAVVENALGNATSDPAVVSGGLKIANGRQPNAREQRSMRNAVDKAVDSLPLAKGDKQDLSRRAHDHVAKISTPAPAPTPVLASVAASPPEPPMSAALINQLLVTGPLVVKQLRDQGLGASADSLQRDIDTATRQMASQPTVQPAVVMVTTTQPAVTPVNVEPVVSPPSGGATTTVKTQPSGTSREATRTPESDRSNRRDESRDRKPEADHRGPSRREIEANTHHDNMRHATVRQNDSQRHEHRAQPGGGGSQQQTNRAASAVSQKPTLAATPQRQRTCTIVSGKQVCN